VSARPDISPFTVYAEGDNRAADLDEVRRAVPILFAPGERHEIRSLPGGRCRVVSSDDVDGAVEAIAELDGTLYFSLNPIVPDAQRAKASTVAHRRWLLIDVDTSRPADVSSTEAEKSKASEVVDAFLEGLGAAGWPRPIIADSGNGWHGLYRIDLPNDKLSHALLKSVLANLSKRYSTDHAKIDTSVYDAPRICKLPGTWSRKGPDTIERPHRRAAIMYVPSTLDVVPVELLDAVAQGPKEPARPAAPVDPFTIRVGSGGLEAYVNAAVTRECAAVAMTPPGERNIQFNKSVFNIGQLADWPEMKAVEAKAELYRTAVSFGYSEPVVLDILNRAWEAGRAAPRLRPEHPADKKAAAAVEAIQAGRSPVKYASEVKPRKIEFLWPGRIPLGKLTTFAGHGGLGKTFVLCDISARISTGAEWPFGGGECASPGDVLFISGEDDESDTLVPRLMECGADRSRIAFLADEFNDAFSLVKLDVMAAAVKALRRPRLIVIDPPTNYLEGVDDHKNSELRSMVLRPLARFAADYNVAIILNNHVNKSSGKDVEAACRVMGSVAWVNGVRTAYLFVRNEGDPEKVSIATIKTNVGKFPSAITYRIVESGDGMAKVEWLEEHAANADQLGKATSVGAAAAAWITDLFRARREWPSTELKRLAKESGISNRALFESAEVEALPIHKRRRASPDGKVSYYWLAEAGWPEEIKEAR
jgi:hypothetical protein